MNSRVSMILLIVLGSFFVYCVQNGARPIGGLGDGAAGPVARAAAQSTLGTSCDGSPGPTLLFDEVVAPTPVGGSCLSREIDITGFRTVVVHRATTDSITQLKLGDAAGFVVFVPPASTNILVIDPQLGRILRFAWSASLSTGLCGTRLFTVAGYGGGVAVAPPPPAMAGGIAN